ncbi:MAG: DUF3536 domain-containing protein [Gemmatimonadales bacterium]
MTAGALRPDSGIPPRQVVIHGHFYQPPREDPWLELVPREFSAAPDHDWNARITRECYAPLAHGRILDAEGAVRRTINAYAWCSFDIGPTLMRWLDRHAPAVRDAMVAGDRQSIARIGAGNAIAMPYDHIILPLASRRDKVTEVRWGIRDFRTRFAREPEGIWLPETAVDEETLDVIASEGLQFTILAPHQVELVPEGGRPGRWRGGHGRELAIFVYDAAAANDVAFGDALLDADRWAGRLAGDPGDGDVSIRSLATDGETFGHHHRWGDLALAALIDRAASGSRLALTNFAALLRSDPPREVVRVVSPSSWSCPHGVERWRRDDGCRFDPATSQQWRAPLRAAFDRLAAATAAAIHRTWPRNAGDPWALRDAAGPDFAGERQLPREARRLLAAGRHALAMFVSCAWFFDDLGRLEPAIALRHAARTLSLLPVADAEQLEAELVATLATARSNDPQKGDGAAIWRRDILPTALGPARLAAALSALREFAPDLLDEIRMPVHEWRVEGDDILLRHRHTSEHSRWRAEPVVHGLIATRVHVREIPAGTAIVCSAGDFPEPVRVALRDLAAPLIFEATLSAADRALLDAGELGDSEARRRTLEGAWRLVERDGIDAAIIVLHAVLDLYELDGATLSPADLTEAETGLAGMPHSLLREALARRFSALAAVAP